MVTKSRFSHRLQEGKMISVQFQDFDFGHEYQQLAANNSQDGAVVCFVGLVRDYNQAHSVTGLHLEHYPWYDPKSVGKYRDRSKITLVTRSS